MKSNTLKTLVVLIVLVLISFVLFEIAKAPETEQFLDEGLAVLPGDDAQVILGKLRFNVSVARTPEERAQGLSGIESLDDDAGLLFVFDTPARYSFWMRDMNIPIDIIWIGEDQQVVHIEESVDPSTYPSKFAPPTSALYVLEVNSGSVERAGVSVGDSVVIEGL